MKIRTWLAWTALATSLAACSGSDSVVGATTDAAADVTADLGVLDVFDAPAPDVPTLDVAPVDVPVDAGFRCAQNTDCAGHAEGSVCDTASGRCVGCLPGADTCPAGQYCPPGANTCAPGCRDDIGCATPADGGVAGVRHCDTTTHQCVQCIGTDQCPVGTLCVGTLCVPGCSTAHGCAGAQACCDGACVDTLANIAACGACGRRCVTANGASACLNGACSIAMCNAPYADCDGDAANGCEADTQSDAAHCGGCGTVCEARANTVTTCAAGHCAYACATGFADCDGLSSNGCEVDLRTSTAHCGGCGRTCAPPNATGTCALGACGVATCAANFGDCDGNAANGCETDLRSSTTNCASCGTVCPAPANSVPACVSGACLSTCTTGFDDCDGIPANGCETNLRSTLTSCGRCGLACTPANATGVCAASACGVASCNANFGDCDGAAANGCETDLRTTPGNCGACGTACSSGVCAGSACQPPRCDDHVRNGSETDVDCGGSCGACGLCAGCVMDSDCLAGTCSSTGRCTFRTTVDIGWYTSCQGPDRSGPLVRVASVPAGTYRITALPSGGDVWSTANPPSTGFQWFIPCDNLSVPSLATPGGVFYTSAAAAFAALPTTTATASFAGGDLVCAFRDSNCGDNQGNTRFTMERSCP